MASARPLDGGESGAVQWNVLIMGSHRMLVRLSIPCMSVSR